MEKNFLQSKFPSIIHMLFPLSWLFLWLRRQILIRIFPNRQKYEVQARLVLDNLVYGESPRIHNSKLYFSDFYAQKITVFNPETEKVENVISIEDDMPSGLGWLPDGRMLIVKMNQMKLVAYDEENRSFESYADLQQYSEHRCNDMVVDNLGRAYVGNFGFDLDKFVRTYQGSATTSLVKVDQNKNVQVVADDLFFPNGVVLTPDGETLLICEMFRAQISAFDVDKVTGNLSNKRVWAKIGLPCDGMCLDAEGYVWVATTQIGVYKTSGAVIRIGVGGRISHIYGFGANGINEGVFACMLYTNPRTQKHTLYVCAANSYPAATKLGTKNGRLFAIQVDVGPAVSNKFKNYNAGYC